MFQSGEAQKPSPTQTGPRKSSGLHPTGVSGSQSFSALDATQALKGAEPIGTCISPLWLVCFFSGFGISSSPYLSPVFQSGEAQTPSPTQTGPRKSSGLVHPTGVSGSQSFSALDATQVLKGAEPIGTCISPLWLVCFFSGFEISSSPYLSPVFQSGEAQTPSPTQTGPRKSSGLVHPTGVSGSQSFSALDATQALKGAEPIGTCISPLWLVCFFSGFEISSSPYLSPVFQSGEAQKPSPTQTGPRKSSGLVHPTGVSGSQSFSALDATQVLKGAEPISTCISPLWLVCFFSGSSSYLRPVFQSVKAQTPSPPETGPWKNSGQVYPTTVSRSQSFSALDATPAFKGAEPVGACISLNAPIYVIVIAWQRGSTTSQGSLA